MIPSPLRPVTAVFAALLLLLPLPAQEKSADDTYPVRIILEARPDAKFYQVEWLEGNEISGDEEAPAGTSLREKVTKTEIRRNLPARYRYFRLRSAYRDGLFGSWGEVVEIQRPSKSAKLNKATGSEGKTGQKTTATGTDGKSVADNKSPDAKKSSSGGKTTAAKQSGRKHGEGAKPVEPQNVFAQVIDRNGREKWVLRGTSVAADRLDENDPLFYEAESLTEKDAAENSNGRKRYNGPIAFTRPGQYRINLYNTEDTAQTTPLQTWTFWVYTDVPRTYVKFYAPFLHGRGGFIVGGKTKIALMPEWSQAATDKVEYRIWADGAQPGNWNKYEDEIEVASFAQNTYGFYNIEYQTTNVAGNTEPPQLRRMLIDTTGPKIEEANAEGGARYTFRDEHFPIVVRIYQGGQLVQDTYFKQSKANDFITAPANAASGYEIHAIDLLGNTTILKK